MQTAVGAGWSRPVASRRRALELSRFTRLFLGSLSAAAAGIHAAALPEHAREHWSSGAFFATAALFQLLWGMAIAREITPGLLRAGAVVNAAFIGVWALSRTAGTPLGPEPWMPEPVGVIDAITVALEVGLLATCLALLRPGAVARLEGRPAPQGHALWAIVAGGLAVAGLYTARTEETSALTLPAHGRHLLIGLAVVAFVHAAERLHRAAPRYFAQAPGPS